MEVTTYVILQAVIAIIAFCCFLKFKLNFVIFGFNVLLMTFITYFLSYFCFTNWFFSSNDFVSSEETGFSPLIYFSLLVGILSFGSNFVFEYKTMKDLNKSKIGYRILYAIVFAKFNIESYVIFILVLSGI